MVLEVKTCEYLGTKYCQIYRNSQEIRSKYFTYHFRSSQIITRNQCFLTVKLGNQCIMLLTGIWWARKANLNPWWIIDCINSWWKGAKVMNLPPETPHQWEQLYWNITLNSSAWEYEKGVNFNQLNLAEDFMNLL